MEKVNSKLTAVFIVSLALSVILWYLLFILKLYNFWAQMAASIIILVITAIIADKNVILFKKITLRHILIGVGSAVLLYVIFYFGNIVSGMILPFKNDQVMSVYNNKTQGTPLEIGLLLLFIIGPGEEIYWRGFIQNFLQIKFGENKGYAIAVALYAGVHIITLNFMLVVAALICGIFWGYIYKKEKSIVPVIISHAIWDTVMFVVLPLM